MRLWFSLALRISQRLSRVFLHPRLATSPNVNINFSIGKYPIFQSSCVHVWRHSYPAQQKLWLPSVDRVGNDQLLESRTHAFTNCLSCTAFTKLIQAAKDKWRVHPMLNLNFAAATGSQQPLPQRQKYESYTPLHNPINWLCHAATKCGARRSF